MRIEQKRFSNKTAFEFGEEALTFTVQDKSGSAEFEVTYEDIPRKASSLEEKNDWLRNIGWIWVLIGVFQAASAIHQGEPLSENGFWLMLGLICLVAYRTFVTRYSVYNSDCGKILVIRDKKHDDIVKEIEERRRNQLRLWYGDVDPNNDPEREIDKFNWLVQEDVLTRAEADALIAQVQPSALGKSPIDRPKVTH